ncbi:hypothetical protein HOP51_20400 [Halomonas sp. MCCC 1A11036]|uniref:Uncharacterized protein n=1 Tax=Billgrantia zhangzhouensis TaxID=2733481 RepID=A0ABS9AKV7_9GAMM|nr:hypothetical protein [Halomonas zhangzhouensis]MCE8022451.1 hypothetical protein [Halomonas zhangzhouensis]
MHDSIESSTTLARCHSRNVRHLARIVLVMLLPLACASTVAWDGLVEKQVFEMDAYTTVSGETWGTDFPLVTIRDFLAE